MQIPLPVRPIDFNPRSPCGERQLPALQRGTDGHFNPRSPCGERHFNDVYSVLLDDISIHAPRVGSDLTNGVSAMSTPLFQSTLPVWGATSLAADTIPAIAVISIHAPRVGSDDHVAYVSGTALDFNPRSPCGERQKLSDCFLWAIRISIHAPRVGSDGKTAPSSMTGLSISIHAPRVGSDFRAWVYLLRPRLYFNPRSPCGERRQMTSLCAAS